MSNVRTPRQHQEYLECNELARQCEPASTICTKDSWLWSALWVLMVVFSLGIYAFASSRREFLERFATTIGPIQGYPSSWPYIPKMTIVHECRHVTQAITAAWAVPMLGWLPWRKYRAWIGLLPMFLMYLLLPFPVMLCYGRYRLELDADIAAWEWLLRRSVVVPAQAEIRVQDAARRRAAVVASGKYFWPWPKPLVVRGYRKAAEKVLARAKREREQAEHARSKS